MSKILLSWLGMTDIRSYQESGQGGLGPVAAALKVRGYRQIYILSDFPKTLTQSYLKWLHTIRDVKISHQLITLKDAMDFTGIYEAAKALANKVRTHHPTDEMVFNLSPGTPAMAAVWILLAKTRFPGTELIESSRQDQKGNFHVRTASVGFDISAEPILDMLWDQKENVNLLRKLLPEKTPNFNEILHKSKAMERVIILARRAAKQNVPVLLLGESGTGKELLANAIHKESTRSAKQFKPINCGAISPSLIESELFGHVKGAFTGAENKKRGVFDLANKGTLFLDEIGDLSFDLQVKLLRALQENQIQPVGSEEDHKVDVRLITATHKNIIELVASGKFREDLFYRLAVAVIKIPPLRERRQDIDCLVDHFMKLINEKLSKESSFGGPKELTPNARIALRNYDWPGNVRELVNTLTRIALWHPSQKISKQAVLDSIITIHSKANSDILNRPLGSTFNIVDVINEVARHYLTRALKESGGNKTAAASLVGLPSHTTFTNWMKRHNLD